MNFKFPLATSSWDRLEYDAIQRVIESGIFTMGENVKIFEKEFSQFFGSKFSLMVNSGSSANLLMIASLFYTKNKKYQLVAGDEIIVPAVAWSTSFFPLYQYGLKIKFVDINIETLNYDLQELASAISEKTRAIMLVNLLGNPNDFNEISNIVENKNIFLLEDNCESMGAKYTGKYAGTFGILGSYSAFFSHHISTMEGGIVTTNDEELYHIMLALRAHGWTRNLPTQNKVTGKKESNAFNESFKFVLPGYNLRPLEMSGAIGIEQLKKLPKLIEGRRRNGKIFQSLLINNKHFMIQKEIGESSWFGFSLIIRRDSNMDRSDLLDRLNKVGFECRPIVSGNFTKNEVMKYLDFEIHGDLKNAKYLDANGLFIGNHHYNIEKAIDLLTKIE